MNSVEIFTGAGGLAIGISNAGFRHKAVIERDKNACETIRENQQRGVQAVKNWSVFETDVAKFDFTPIKAKGGVDLLAGGPPCQPFSLGGKHHGYLDNDEPAKTLKAGVHGVPGGENMLAFQNGQVRYFTVREAARLQTFPDEYFFPHCWTQTMRQLGNAVPVALAEVIASSIWAQLLVVRAVRVY